MTFFAPNRRLEISKLPFAAIGTAMGRVGVSITRNILKKIQDDAKQNVPHTNYITRITGGDFFFPKGERDGVPVNAFDDKKAWEIALGASAISVAAVAFLTPIPLLSIGGAAAFGAGSMLLGAIGEKLHIDSKNKKEEARNKSAVAIQKTLRGHIVN